MILTNLLNTKKSILRPLQSAWLQDSHLPHLDRTIGCYATVNKDPRTSMNIHFHIKEDHSDVSNVMQYRMHGSILWKTVESSHTKDFLKTDKVIKWFSLMELDPDTIYEVRLESDEKTYTFRTLPETNERDIRVAFTSDVTHDGNTMDRNLAKGALADYNPDLICLVGDIAHADGVKVSRWNTFWGAWFNHAYTKDGHMIPILSTLGNHDGFTDRGQLWYFDNVNINIPYFYNFFPRYENDKSYGVIDVGDYLSIIMLDGGHSVPVAGEQTTWLENVLQQRMDRIVIPAMHYSPYPAVYGYDDGEWVAPYMRQLWTPLFKQHDIKVAYTGHNHVFSVTPFVSGDSLDEDGTIYIGQGASFGTDLRVVTNSGEWWVEDSGDGEYYRHFVAMTVQQNNLKVEAITVDGNVLYSKDIIR